MCSTRSHRRTIIVVITVPLLFSETRAGSRSYSPKFRDQQTKCIGCFHREGDIVISRRRSWDQLSAVGGDGECLFAVRIRLVAMIMREKFGRLIIPTVLLLHSAAPSKLRLRHVVHQPLPPSRHACIPNLHDYYYDDITSFRSSRTENYAQISRFPIKECYCLLLLYSRFVILPQVRQAGG